MLLKLQDAAHFLADMDADTKAAVESSDPLVLPKLQDTLAKAVVHVTRVCLQEFLKVAAGFKDLDVQLPIEQLKMQSNYQEMQSSFSLIAKQGLDILSLPTFVEDSKMPPAMLNCKLGLEYARMLTDNFDKIIAIITEGPTNILPEALIQVTALQHVSRVAWVRRSPEDDEHLLKLKAFYTDGLQTTVETELEARAKAPLETFGQHYLLVENFAKTFGGNATNKEEMTKLCTDIARIDCDKDAEALLSLSIGHHATCRHQYLIRLVRLLKHAGHLTSQLICNESEVVISDKIVAELQSTRREHHSMQVWLETNKQQAADIEHNWWASCCLGDQMVAIVTNLFDIAKSHFTREVQGLIQTSKSTFPGRALVDNSKLLVDVALQTGYLEAVRKADVTRVTIKVSAILNWLPQLSRDVGIVIEGDSDLKKLRMNGKRIAGLGHVIEQLSAKNLPKDTAQLPEHAKTIIGKLKQKGIGAGERMIPLPDYAQKALEALASAVAQAASSNNPPQ